MTINKEWKASVISYAEFLNLSPSEVRQLLQMVTETDSQIIREEWEKRKARGKEIDRYMQMPWTIEMTYSHEDETWFVRVPHLSESITDGETPNKAIQMLNDLMYLLIEDKLESGVPIEEPKPWYNDDTG